MQEIRYKVELREGDLQKFEDRHIEALNNLDDRNALIIIETLLRIQKASKTNCLVDRKTYVAYCWITNTSEDQSLTFTELRRLLELEEDNYELSSQR